MTTPFHLVRKSRALADVMAERIRQVSPPFNHDDSALPLDVLPCKAKSFTIDALDLLRPGDRHNPATARRRLVKAAALLLAGIDRIDGELSPPNTAPERGGGPLAQRVVEG